MDKIICLGKNYLEHAKELGDSVPESPVLFLKPPSSLVEYPGICRLPKDLGEIHPECEIVIRVAKRCYRVAPQEASRFVDAMTLGLDLTLRDVQARLKKAGHPWEISKAFRDSAAVGAMIPIDAQHLALDFEHSIDGQLTQRGNVREMRLGIWECISLASEHFQLFPGDLIFTGTPKGVRGVQPGQKSHLRWGASLHFELMYAES